MQEENLRFDQLLERNSDKDNGFTRFYQSKLSPLTSRKTRKRFLNKAGRIFMMNMFIVLLHTYWTKLKSKTFITTTLTMALFMIAFLNMDAIISIFDEDAADREYDVIVSAETGQLFEEFSAETEALNARIHLEEAEESNAAYRDAVLAGTYDASFVIEKGGEGLRADYYAPTINQTYLPGQLEQSLQQVYEQRVMNELGLEDEEIEALYTSVSVESTALDEEARSESELQQARWFVYILLFVIYFSVLFLGNMIASEVATEKSSRVMEILISSASPIQQMFGKILGVGLLGLTQYTAILVIALFSFLGNAGTISISELNQGMQGVPLDEETFFAGPGPVFSLYLFLYAFLFFVLGYLLYATLAAMLGSIVTNIEDVGQAVAPMNMLVIAAFMIAMFSLVNPGATIVTFTSYIPFFTPMIMFLRIGMGEAAFWEVALSVVVMIVTIVLLAIIAARIYRGGVLLYGNMRAFKALKNAFRLSKKT